MNKEDIINELKRLHDEIDMLRVECRGKIIDLLRVECKGKMSRLRTIIKNLNGEL